MSDRDAATRSPRWRRGARRRRAAARAGGCAARRPAAVGGRCGARSSCHGAGRAADRALDPARTDCSASSQAPVGGAPVRHRRPRARRASRASSTARASRCGRRPLHAARDARRRPARARRRLLPRLRRPGHHARHRRRARLPVPDPRGRPRGDPRAVAAQRRYRARRRGDPGVIRVTRGEALAIREQDFVPAAVANGAGDGAIIGRHVLPNIAGTLLVQATVCDPGGDHRRGGALLPRPRRSAADAVVGVDAHAAQPFLAQAPWLAIWPGLAIFLADAGVQPARRRPARRPRPEERR